MAQKKDVWQGTLALMVLKTLDTLGPLHGYGIARRIEQTSGDLLAVNYGTLYPALLKLEQAGYIRSEWGLSDNNRKAKYYKLTRAGKKQLEREARDWEQTTSILARFLAPGEEPSGGICVPGYCGSPAYSARSGTSKSSRRKCALICACTLTTTC